MNSQTEFCYSTRTLTDDYKVYTDNGAKTLASEYFSDLRKKCGATSDNQRVTALFEEDGKIYLTAFNLPTQRRDTSGRVISFSFCLTFLENGPEARNEAQKAYHRLTSEKNAIVAKIDELFVEKNISFDTLHFVEWLCDGEPIVFSFGTGKDDWPRKHFVLRSCDEEVFISEAPAKSEPNQWEEMTRKWKKRFIALAVFTVLIAVACGGLILKSTPSSQESKELARKIDDLRGLLFDKDEEIRKLSRTIAESVEARDKNISTEAMLAEENQRYLDQIDTLKTEKKRLEGKVKKAEEAKEFITQKYAERAGNIVSLEADVASQKKEIKRLESLLGKTDASTGQEDKTIAGAGAQTEKKAIGPTGNVEGEVRPVQGEANSGDQNKKEE